jgi:hypothetical protein
LRAPPANQAAGDFSSEDASVVNAHAHNVEIFGRSVGRLVADGSCFIFYAADRTLLELDRRSFKGLTEAEEAVHQALVRRMHRRGPENAFAH